MFSLQFGHHVIDYIGVAHEMKAILRVVEHLAGLRIIKHTKSPVSIYVQRIGQLADDTRYLVPKKKVEHNLYFVA